MMTPAFWPIPTSIRAVSLAPAEAFRKSDRRKPPFSPEQVVEEFAKIVRSYPCTKIYGDRYGGEWPTRAVPQAWCELRVQRETEVRTTSLERRTARGGRSTQSTMHLVPLMTLPIRWPVPTKA